MSVDVCVLTRERRGELVAALAELTGQLGPGDRCYVLENGCPQRSTEGLTADFGEIAFARSEENLGVAGGRNHVARLGDGDVLLFLDDDARPGDGLLDGVRARFAADPDLGVLALRVEDPASGRPRRHEVPSRRKTLADRPFAPTYFLGGAVAIRRDAFEAAGGYDERLFYSLEELDLSLRLHRLGVRFAYDPALRVRHRAVGEGRPGGQFFYFTARNRWWVPAKHLPWPMVASHVAVWTLVLGVRAAAARELGHWWRGVRDGARGLRAARGDRDPLPRPVLARLRAQGGRLWW